MRCIVKDNMLEVIINDVFDFSVANDLLNYCKAHLKNSPGASVRLNLENVSEMKTCAIGSILLIYELCSSRLNIYLMNCAPEINQLFDSDILDGYLNKTGVKPGKCAVCYGIVPGV